jgi:hypothetical protein
MCIATFAIHTYPNEGQCRNGVGFRRHLALTETGDQQPKVASTCTSDPAKNIHRRPIDLLAMLIARLLALYSGIVQSFSTTPLPLLIMLMAGTINHVFSS